MSGYCCTVMPCEYGRIMNKGELKNKVDKVGYRVNHSECYYLASPDDTGRRICKKYKEIKEIERSAPEVLRMMGYGCSSAIGNTARDKIIERENHE